MTKLPFRISTVIKAIILILPFVAAFNAAAQVTISGINEAQFIYRDAPDSLSNFFHNEANLKFNYRNIDFGMTFTADLPRYSHYESVEHLEPSMIKYQWERFYILANLPNLTLRAGSFNEFFGNGLTFRSYRDKTFEHDTTLSGLSTRLFTDYVNLKAFYGSLPNRNEERYNETIGGVDMSSSYIEHLNIGLSFLTAEEYYVGSYRNRLVGGARAEVYFDSFDVTGEYSEHKLTNINDNKSYGKATYASFNQYFDAFTLSAGYKKYEKFNLYYNDLPTVNSSEEPLSDRFEPGYDEEGILGQIEWNPTLTSTITATYSEAWNSGFDIRQSDLLIKGSNEFDNITFGFEYAQLEGIDKDRKDWYRELNPALTFDFNLFDRSNHTKFRYKVKETKKAQEEDKVYAPAIQYDIFFDKFSLSLNGETEVREVDDLTDNPPIWLGAEVTAQIFSHTEVKFFVGEERGGKVCRSGQCFYTSPFKGVKLDVTTRF